MFIPSAFVAGDCRLFCRIARIEDFAFKLWDQQVYAESKCGFWCSSLLYTASIGVIQRYEPSTLPCELEYCYIS